MNLVEKVEMNRERGRSMDGKGNGEFRSAGTKRGVTRMRHADWTGTGSAGRLWEWGTTGLDRAEGFLFGSLEQKGSLSKGQQRATEVEKSFSPSRQTQNSNDGRCMPPCATHVISPTASSSGTMTLVCP